MAPSHQCLSLLALSLLALLLSSHWPLVKADSERKIDCRRIVFHPYCRGISAKRASSSLKLMSEDEKNEAQLELLWADISNRHRNRMPDKSQHHQHRSHSMVDSVPAQDNQVDNSVKPNDYYMSIPQTNYDPNGSFRRSDPYYQSQVPNNGQWLNRRREYNSGYYRGGGGPRWNGPFNSGPQTERLVQVVEYVPNGPHRVQYPSEQYRTVGRQNRIMYQPYYEHLKRRTTSRVPRQYPSAPYDLDYVPYRRQRQY